MVFAMTGARHGEGLALMWRDQNANEIIIRRNWSDEYRDGEPEAINAQCNDYLSRRQLSVSLRLRPELGQLPHVRISRDG